MSTLQLQVFVRSVFGRQTIYPACAQAERVAALANQKTLTDRELKIAREMGFEVVFVADPRAVAAMGGAR